MLSPHLYVPLVSLHIAENAFVWKRAPCISKDAVEVGYANPGGAENTRTPSLRRSSDQLPTMPPVGRP